MAKNAVLKAEKNGKKRIFLIATGLGLVVMITGLLFFRLPSRGLSTGLGKAEADSFLEKLRKGQIDQAWQSAASDFKSYMGKDTLRTLVKKNPALKELAKQVDGDSHNGDARNVYEYLSQKSSKRIAIGVALENGQPKVDSLEIR